MYPSDYERQGTIRLHRQALMREAETERLLAGRSATVRSNRGGGIHRSGFAADRSRSHEWHLAWMLPALFFPFRHALAGVGRWLVAVGTRLQARYADRPA